MAKRTTTPLKPLGVTPMTVQGRPFTVSVLPTKSARPPWLLPQLVARDDDGNIGVGPAFVGVVETAERGLRAEHREIIFRGEKRPVAARRPLRPRCPPT